MQDDLTTAHNEIKKLLSKVFGLEMNEITEDCHIDNTPQWDSLAHLRIVIEIESKFGVFLDPDEIQSILDYKSIYEIINKIKGKQVYHET